MLLKTQDYKMITISGKLPLRKQDYKMAIISGRITLRTMQDYTGQ